MGKEGWASETDEAVASVAAVVALASAAVRRVDGEGFFKFVVFVLCWAERAGLWQWMRRLPRRRRHR